MVSQTNKLLLDSYLRIEQLEKTVEQLRGTINEPIAIVSAACRFPGFAYSLDQFWDVLCKEDDLVQDIPNDRWDKEQFWSENLEEMGTMYTKKAYFIDEVDQFDPYFFGISPREAVHVDPQQRLLLEVAWEALENSGINLNRIKGSSTGVYVGMMTNDYARLQTEQLSLTDIDAYVGSGTGLSFPAGRLSYALGLQGPSMVISTACSSSLVSLHVACQSLRDHSCDSALAGGVNLIFSPAMYVALSRMQAISVDGLCKTFDASADGYGRGEGCGMLVLKRLSDALEENLPILATVESSATNHNGDSGGLTVPHGQAQEKLLQTALDNAGINPQCLGYLEVHGTGTSLGDPIELQAVQNVYGVHATKDNPLNVGSVKTNIGHLEAAAGVASVIKVCLMLQKGSIPASLHVKELNSHIPWDSMNINVPTEIKKWSSRAGKMYAAVSSFGLSGINAHAILSKEEKYVQQKPTRENKPQLITLSAHTEQAMDAVLKQYQSKELLGQISSIENLGRTTRMSRSSLEYRWVTLCEHVDDFKQLMESVANGEEMNRFTFQGSNNNLKSQKVVFLFTGQGSQYRNMGLELYEKEPFFKKTMDECDQILRPIINDSILTIIFDETAVRLNDTRYTQPALFALEYSIAQLWMSWGIKPAAVLGHSVGEYVAATVAGILSLEDGLKLIAHRAALMSDIVSDGRMVAVFSNALSVNKMISVFGEKLSIAAYNAPTEIVVSGDGEMINEFIKMCDADGVEYSQLVVSHAFHSYQME